MANYAANVGNVAKVMNKLDTHHVIWAAARTDAWKVEDR